MAAEGTSGGRQHQPSFLLRYLPLFLLIPSASLPLHSLLPSLALAQSGWVFYYHFVWRRVRERQKVR